MHMGHDPSLLRLESQGHRLRSRVSVSKDSNVVGVTSIVDRGSFFASHHPTLLTSRRSAAEPAAGVVTWTRASTCR